MGDATSFNASSNFHEALERAAQARKSIETALGNNEAKVTVNFKGFAFETKLTERQAREVVAFAIDLQNDDNEDDMDCKSEDDL